MSQSRRNRNTIELGYDSFLDIVANLVGILIILVVVLGAQSTSQIEQAVQKAEQQPGASEQQLQRLAKQTQRSTAAQADSNRFEQLILKHDSMIDQKRNQRAFLMDLLSQAETAWENNQEKFDKEKMEAAKRRTTLDEASRELDKLQGEQERLLQQPEKVVEIQHLPTPMAKTVFGDEIHFRLKGNRLSVVPVERLIEEIKLDFERVFKSSTDGQREAAVGPVGGYIARYTMEKTKGMVSKGNQVQMATRIQLVNLSIEPLKEPHGDPINQFFSDRQKLDIELAGRDPAATTVTVWVYPDSFSAFRTLKETLYARGFATAARPLPMDHVISGGPDGSRSQAQ